jgi:hypothetical protein
MKRGLILIIAGLLFASVAALLLSWVLIPPGRVVDIALDRGGRVGETVWVGRGPHTVTLVLEASWKSGTSDRICRQDGAAGTGPQCVSATPGQGSVEVGEGSGFGFTFARCGFSGRCGAELQLTLRSDVAAEPPSILRHKVAYGDDGSSAQVVVEPRDESRGAPLVGYALRIEGDRAGDPCAGALPPGAPLEIRLSPRAEPYLLELRALDAAGNCSPPMPYRVAVPDTGGLALAEAFLVERNGPSAGRMLSDATWSGTRSAALSWTVGAEVAGLSKGSVVVLRADEVAPSCAELSREFDAKSLQRAWPAGSEPSEVLLEADQEGVTRVWIVRLHARDPSKCAPLMLPWQIDSLADDGDIQVVSATGSGRAGRLGSGFACVDGCTIRVNLTPREAFRRLYAGTGPSAPPCRREDALVSSETPELSATALGPGLRLTAVDNEGFLSQPVWVSVEDRAGRCGFSRRVDLVRGVSFARRFERLKAVAIERANERERRIAAGDAACRAGIVSASAAAAFDTTATDAELVAVVRRLDAMRERLATSPKSYHFAAGEVRSSEQVNSEFDSWAGQQRFASLGRGQQVVWTLDSLQVAALNGELSNMTGRVLCGLSRWPDGSQAGVEPCPGSCLVEQPTRTAFAEVLRQKEQDFAW